jgi:hypothetical protein
VGNDLHHAATLNALAGLQVNRIKMTEYGKFFSQQLRWYEFRHTLRQWLIQM